MFRLSLLLIGAEAFRTRWYWLCLLGALLIAAAFFLAFHASDGLVVLAGRAIGIVFLFMGAGNLLRFMVEARRSVRVVTLLLGLSLIAVGGVVIVWPGRAEHVLAALLCVALLVDGLGRIGIGQLLHLPDWRWRLAYSSLQLLFAAMFLLGWPLPLERSIALCVALIFAFRGWMLIRFGLLFRTLEKGASILTLPIFAKRGWYETPRVAEGPDEAAPGDSPMTVHVWTPVGSASVSQRRPVVDRYIAAIDAQGVISTGHASLELPPSLYISHYPAVELDHTSADFASALRSTADNDVAGRFQPSYAYESAEWCPADANVTFHNFNAAQLRAFWAGYRQNDTYNLTNRNCSVVVAQALDATLEGSLSARSPWLQLILLLTNPDVWIGAMLRSRAHLSTWTPGLVLDYAHTLERIVEGRAVNWGESFGRFVRRLGFAADVHSKAPA